MSTLTNSEYRIISDHGLAVVRQRCSNQQNALFARRSFRPGEVIAEFWAGTIAAEPTYLTVQVDVGKHITLQPEFLQYINHSCAPNVFFNTTTLELVALKEIGKDEEMTFFYPSTEWEMIQPFHCYCGSPACLKEIRGAAYIAKNILKQYRLTDFIQNQVTKRSARKVRA
jgi:hypothetical protein